MTTLPTASLLSLIAITKQIRRHILLIRLLLSTACADGAVTFWFDQTSRLTIF